MNEPKSGQSDTSAVAQDAGQSPVGVLFVDDEKHILAALRRLMMDEENVEVHVANSGPEGLAILASEKNIGLIVSDQRMPVMTGAEFLAKARQVAPDAIRVMLTGYADINATIDAINKGGAFRYISKPWDDGAFLDTLRECLHYYRLSAENIRLAGIVHRQNEELKSWNAQLKSRVLQQTAALREANMELGRKNARLLHNLDGTIQSFSALLEMRSKDVRSHSRNVERLALSMAESLKMEDEAKKELHAAALLHDIGKIGIPDDLAGIPQEMLGAEELEEYKRHPVRGQAAIDAVEDLRGAGVLIRHHHEHLDGTGFPDGLSGAAIPLGARILALADYVDTHIRLESENPIEKVLQAVKQRLGTFFDPALGPHFAAAVREVYGELAPGAGMVKKEVSPMGIRVGMILAEDLFAGTGMLLLSKGTVLNQGTVEGIWRHHKIDPFLRGIKVLVKG